MNQSVSLTLDAAAQRRKRLARLLREKARQAITVLPTSIAQRGVWYMQQSAPASCAYHVTFCVRVLSAIDADCAHEALQLLTDRHAMLRATFHHRGDELEMEVRGGGEPQFSLIDARDLDDSALRRLVEQAHAEPFDLIRGPLIRLTLFTRGAEDHVLLLVLHHLICDGWSLTVLLREFMELYEAESLNRPVRLPPKDADFDKFIVHQQRWLDGPAAQASRTYWLDRLGGELPELDLPHYTARQASAPGEQRLHEFTVSRGLLADLNRAAQASGVTLVCLLLGAYQLFLMRVSRQDDVVVGVPMAGRTEPGYEGVVGHFVNLVAMRNRLDGDPSFREFAGQVWDDLRQAIEHQEFPFLELVRLLRPGMRTPSTPVFRAYLNVLKPQQDNPVYGTLVPQPEPRPWGPLKILQFPLEIVEEAYDLAVRMVETSEDIGIKIQYDAGIFTGAAIEHFAACFEELLHSIAADPGCGIRQLNLLPPVERHRILDAWNATERPQDGPATVVAMIEARIDRSPDAPALVADGETLSYAGLEKRSNQLANYLIAQGCVPGDIVAVCAERSVALVVGLLGALKAGVVYVPIDPRYPQDRIDFVLADCGALLLLTTQQIETTMALPDTIPHVWLDGPELAGVSDARPAIRAGTADLAYVIYTSGSTGRPKGVQIAHGALGNFIGAMAEQLPIGPADGLLSVTTPAFDIFILELFLPLAVGARVELASDLETRDGALLAARIAGSNVTFMQATPATWRMLLAARFEAQAPFTCLCGGEALDPELARQLLAARVDLWNMYGPTETTVWSCIDHVRSVENNVISIGRPIANTQAYVLDNYLQPVPIGVIGTLFLGGAGLARGYLNRPELTAEKFIPSPFDPNRSDRLYDTGDLARFLPDGRLECLGRVDQQVKLRGYRIELGEIEAVLAGHPAIEQAVCTVLGTQSDARLVAFVRAHAAHSLPAARDLKSWLRRLLPDYMVPSDIEVVEAFPQTPNGKIDRKALGRMQPVLAPAIDTTDTTKRQILPNEQFLIEIWQDLLGLKTIAVDDNFFEIGGHSLLAAKMIAQLESYHNRTLSIALLAKAPTIRELAQAIEEMPELNPGPCLFTFRTGDDLPPLVLMPSLAGTALHWREFAAKFEPGRPIVGIYYAGEPDYTADASLESLARQCAIVLAKAYPDHPCHLLGYSFGGTLAFEVAHQLKRLNGQVGVIAVLDKGPNSLTGSPAKVWPVLKNVILRLPSLLNGGTLRQKLNTITWFLRIASRRKEGHGAVMQQYILGDGEIPERSRRLVSWFTEIEGPYRPKPISGNMLVIRASKRPIWGPFQHDLGWSDYVKGEIDVKILEGGHSEMLDGRHMATVTTLISQSLRDFEGKL